jgi:hypothetical protein
MTRLAATIVSCTVIAACGGPTSPSSIVGRSGAFVLTGTVRELEGIPIAGATVDLQGSLLEPRSTLSAQDGTFRFDGIAGTFTLRAIKDGYEVAAKNVSIQADQVIDLTVQRVGRLVAGEVFRGIVDQPPCDPRGWDAQAPCRRIRYTPIATGTLTLRVTWTGASDLDLILADRYWPSVDHAIRATAHVEAGREYEIRLNAYYAPVTFEMTADLFGN